MQPIEVNAATRAPSPGRSPSRGRFIAVGVVVVVLVIAAVVGAAVHKDHHSTGKQAGSAAATADAAGCPSAPPTAPPGGSWGVGRVDLTLVDTSRPTNADASRNLAAKPQRTLPVVLTYPIAPSASKVMVTDGKPVGRFPLVIFSHGVTSDGPTMAAVTADLVRAGYVVASPTFPMSSGPGADINDLANQPADVHFLAEKLDGAVRQLFPTDDPIRADCIAIAGHSLGSVTTLLAGYGACCDWTGPTAPTAVIEVSGLLVPIQPGTFDNAPKTPLLLIHGDADQTVNYSGSVGVFDKLMGPRWFLTLLHGSHSGPFLTPWRDVVMQSMIAFLNAQLEHAPDGLQGFGQVAHASGVATWRTAP